MAKSKAKPKAKDTSRTSKSGKSLAKTKPSRAANGVTFAASHFIDERIRSLGDWRGETLMEIRRLIHEADPDVIEECKWVKPSNPWGVPVWSHAGIICTGETYKEVVKLTFAKGASLADPRGLFNSSLEGNARRAIDIREGEMPEAEAFKELIQTAAEENLRSSAPKKSAKGKSGANKSKLQKNEQGVVLLSGGNPQIAKGYGDEPVQAYISAMPGWKSALGRRLDQLIEQTVPHVYKAVKWNSPFYGFEGQGWFLGIHCFAKYIKVAFFRGRSLKPLPPGESKQKEVRYLNIHENDQFDEKQFCSWVKQASELPGEKM